MHIRNFSAHPLAIYETKEVMKGKMPFLVIASSVPQRRPATTKEILSRFDAPEPEVINCSGSKLRVEKPDAWIPDHLPEPKEDVGLYVDTPTYLEVMRRGRATHDLLLANEVAFFNRRPVGVYSFLRG